MHSKERRRGEGRVEGRPSGPRGRDRIAAMDSNRSEKKTLRCLRGSGGWLEGFDNSKKKKKANQLKKPLWREDTSKLKPTSEKKTGRS